MRMLLGIGGSLCAVLVVAFAWSFWPDPRSSDAPARLQPLEETLGRPFVLYVDGNVSPEFRTALSDLDAKIGGIAGQAEMRTLADLDVYVMVRDSWDVFRSVTAHDLAELIRQTADRQGANTNMAWFKAMITPDDGAARDLLVILATRSGLAQVSDFCFAVSTYEIARFASNGAAFTNATDGAGTQWRQCHAKGWGSVTEMMARVNG